MVPNFAAVFRHGRGCGETASDIACGFAALGMGVPCPFSLLHCQFPDLELLNFELRPGNRFVQVQQHPRHVRPGGKFR